MQGDITVGRKSLKKLGDKFYIEISQFGFGQLHIEHKISPPTDINDALGKRFIERFDANSYVVLTHVMDYFDLAAAYGSLGEALGRTQARFLMCSYTSDWLFPTAQSLELVEALIAQRKHVTFLELDSSKGHDAFLLEIEQLEELVKPFLEQTYVPVRDQARHEGANS